MDTFLLETVVVGAGPTAVLPLGRPMSGRTGNRNLILKQRTLLLYVIFAVVTQ